eukprot:66755_1
MRMRVSDGQRESVFDVKRIGGNHRASECKLRDNKYVFTKEEIETYQKKVSDGRVHRQYQMNDVIRKSIRYPQRCEYDQNRDSSIGGRFERFTYALENKLCIRCCKPNHRASKEGIGWTRPPTIPNE